MLSADAPEGAISIQVKQLQDPTSAVAPAFEVMRISPVVSIQVEAKAREKGIGGVEQAGVPDLDRLVQRVDDAGAIEVGQTEDRGQAVLGQPLPTSRRTEATSIAKSKATPVRLSCTQKQ